MVRSRAFWLKSRKIFAPRSSFHQAVVTSPGIRRSTSRANAIAACRTSVNVHRGRIRTLMWTPRPPEVFGYPVIPSSASRSRTAKAAVRASSNVVPGCGSTSMRSSSGWSRSVFRTGHGWKSIVPRLTHHAMAAISVGQSAAAVRPLGNRTVTVSIHSGCRGSRFW